uniref:Amino acid transporter n=1 Tax=Poecilia formosa TaxID=48698 RepID=A0A096M7W6_POEFO
TGFGIGFLLRATTLVTEELKEWIKVPGEMLINMLKMFAVSLIVTSVVAGVTGLNTRVSRKTAIITGTFVCGSTSIAVILGMFLALTIKPGVLEHDLHSDKKDEESSNNMLRQSSHFLHVFANMVPESFFQAFYEQGFGNVTQIIFFSQYETEIIQIFLVILVFSVLSFMQNGTEMKLVGRYVEGPNMLGLVIWSFAIGILLNRVGQEARITVEAIQCLNDAIKIIVNWILWYLPIGVMFLITEHVLEVTDWDAVLKLTKLVGVVFAGYVQISFLFHLCYQIDITALRKKEEGPTCFALFQVEEILSVLLDFDSQSAATLPVTLQCCEENVKVDKKLCRLMLPIVTSINRTGMAFYEVVAVVFIAQLNDITLEVGQIIAIGLSSAIVTFGRAGIPVTGAVTTILILTAVGLPAEDAAILVGVEWILDHFITVVNVLVNVFGVAITNHVWHDDLISLDKIPSLDEPRPSKDIELDLSFLESDEEFIPPVSASPTRSNSPR